MYNLGLAYAALPWLLELATGVPGNRLWERVASVAQVGWVRVVEGSAAHVEGASGIYFARFREVREGRDLS